MEAIALLCVLGMAALLVIVLRSQVRLVRLLSHYEAKLAAYTGREEERHCNNVPLMHQPYRRTMHDN